MWTSIASNSVDTSVSGICLGGMIWVIYPLSSCLNAFVLNPAEINAVAPKLELELVIEISPPVSLTKCWAYPIANTDTAWITALLVTLIWLFLYSGLYFAFEFVLNGAERDVLSSYWPSALS